MLTRREFEQGFGSHTPIFDGQTKTVRYYMNFRKALEVHKKVRGRLVGWSVAQPRGRAVGPSDWRRM